MPSSASSAVFDQLDRWRHFPSYQLERRADIFFALFLPGVLARFTRMDVLPTLIPEFPIKRDLIWPDHPTRKSVKVDYLGLSVDGSTAFLIELKTDVGSRRADQDHYLNRAVELGLDPLLRGYLDILQSTAAHQKYFHLTHQLAALGLLSVPDSVEAHLYPRPRPGLRARLRDIEVRAAPPHTRVIYVQPTGGPPGHTIDFDFMAAHLDGLEDPFAARFAQSLRRWCQPAGTTRPPR